LSTQGRTWLMKLFNSLRFIYDVMYTLGLRFIGQFIWTYRSLRQVAKKWNFGNCRSRTFSPRALLL